jgi:hypothetical protein
MNKKKNYPQLINYFSSKDVRGNFVKFLIKNYLKNLILKLKK